MVESGLKLELRVALNKNRQFSQEELPLYYSKKVNDKGRIEYICRSCNEERIVPPIMSYVHYMIKHKERLIND